MSVRSLTVLAVTLALAAAPAAAGAATAPIASTAASAAADGSAAALAADGRTSTAWRPRGRGRWRWRAQLDGAQALRSVRFLLVGPRRHVTVATSAGRGRFTRVRRVLAGNGHWRTVRVRRSDVRAVQLKGPSRPHSARLAEVQVGVAAPSAADPVPAPQQSTAVEQAFSYAPTGPAPVPPANLFAGVLDRPFDPAHLTQMPFGKRSHALQPWRAYLDTPPAQRLRDAVGINFNITAGQAPYAARLLAANGFHRARIEISWGEVDYDHLDQLYRAGDWRAKLLALRSAGLRPLLLLNSNEARPAPARTLSLTVATAAAAGARTVQLSSASAALVVPGRTGFDFGGRAAAVLITSVTAAGNATLSRPLPLALAAGAQPATSLRYEPFRPLTKPDGTPDSRGVATMNGWLDYVRTVTSFAASVLGSTNFDVEVTNEVTFGAAFYDINQYYSPALTSQPLDKHVLLERTVGWIKDPAHGLTGVRVGSGVSNQTPWDSPATAPPGLDALDKHPYPRYLRFPAATLSNSLVDGNGQPTSFAPAYTTFFPEYYLTGIQTESLVRDIAPIVSMVTDSFGRTLPHGRDVLARDGTKKQIWITETGLETGWAAANLAQSLTRADIERLRAKSALRTLVAFVNKGVTQVDLFAASSPEWALIGADFWTALQASGTYPGDGAGGPAISAVGRMIRAVGSATVQTPRSLTLASIGDYDGRVQWAGDGLMQPPLRDRDALAFMPFQASDHRFVVPVYVMTRNMVTTYGSATGPARYDLPAERFRLTIGGTDAARAMVSVIDPLTGEAAPVTVVDRSATGWLVVDVPVTDSPRLLIIDDSTP